MITNILLTFSFLFSGSGMDSIRTETIDGKTFIIHRVEQKETLFSISRRYGVALVIVVESNPNAGSGLEIGELVKIPYTPNKNKKTTEGIVHKVGQKETLYSISKQYGVSVDDLKSWNKLTGNNLSIGQELLIRNIIPDKPKGNTHTVTASETMYAISKQYGVTIQHIKDWNQLQSNDLKPGQVIFISSPMNRTITGKDLNGVSNTEPNTMTTKPQSTESKSNSTVIPVTESVVGTDEVHETGMALLLEGTEGNRRYLAHHRSVKPGTIIRVKNNATRKEVFVRVVDNLIKSEESDVVLRISQSAFERLGGNGKFSVEVTYFK